MPWKWKKGHRKQRAYRPIGCVTSQWGFPSIHITDIHSFARALRPDIVFYFLPTHCCCCCCPLLVVANLWSPTDLLFHTNHYRAVTIYPIFTIDDVHAANHSVRVRQMNKTEKKQKQKNEIVKEYEVLFFFIDKKKGSKYQWRIQFDLRLLSWPFCWGFFFVSSHRPGCRMNLFPNEFNCSTSQYSCRTSETVNLAFRLFQNQC